MNQVDPASVRVVIANYLRERASGFSGEAAELDDDYDLFLSGAIDSLGLLGLATMLQETFGDHIDFEELDAEEMTVVGPLCRFVAKQAVRA